MISFFSEDIDFNLDNEAAASEWITQVITKENHDLGEISIILCSDEYLLKMNQEHLNHDYYTDIITFEYQDDPVTGDLFISIDRVRENALGLNISFEKEIARVMIHGVLHIMGYGDKSEEDKRAMRAKEEECLKLL